MAESDLSTLISKIKGIKRGGGFRPFIDFIQFPKYRNFEKDARVEFEFPLTVIVGPNGSGKTSLLHALSGCPGNRSVGHWWFGTFVDPIDADMNDDRRRQNLSEVEKSAFWYGYQSDGTSLEVVKTRIRRPGDPDYWEPSRPIAKYGMTRLPRGKRNPAIEMDAIYLNFKTQLNAFDRCFHFHPRTLLTSFAKTDYWKRLMANAKPRQPRISDYLRARSRRLRNVLVDRKTIQIGRNEMHKPVIELTPAELESVSEIIGRTYTAGIMVEHRFYELWGTSVLFTDSRRSYSEAFAGSGEAAVVRLVHEITNSAPGRLILLDEPETSLHPGAQEKLIQFLLEKVLEKRLQIVISTHSPAFVRRLPLEAIRVLAPSPDGHIKVTTGVTPDEAFYILGHPTENKIHVIVEDILAKRLVDAVIGEIGRAAAAKFSVQFRPGGESAIKQDAVVYMTAPGTRPFYLLDGDKKCDKFDLQGVSVCDTAADLDERIRKVIGVKVAFRQDSNMPEEDKKKQRLDFMRHCNDRLIFFPFNSPEEAIWDDAAAMNLLKSVCDEPTISQARTQIDAETDYKEKISLLTKAMESSGCTFTGSDILTVQTMLVKRFCNTRNEVFRLLEDMLKGLIRNA